jgi:aminoglycoside/choline kinase family phosphotransferase
MTIAAEELKSDNISECAEMLVRGRQIKQFLDSAGLEDCRKIRITGDASHRRYQRIFQGENRYILMDCPPDKEALSPYIMVANILRERGFSAPEIIKSDVETGLALLEDFDNTLFSKFFHDAAIENAALVQRQLYQEAVNILIALAQQGLQAPFNLDELPHYDETLLEREVGLFAEWFLPEIFQGAQLKQAQHSWKLLWQFMIGSTDLTPQVLVHRDFHVDNLCWLSEREGLKKVGLLDFQDAVCGRTAYDLVSLLEDARRDVPATLQAQMKNNFIKALNLNEADFNREYAFYGAQRNAKILGIFVRLYRRDGKPRYLAMIERVWQYFLSDISHPALHDVQEWINQYFDNDARRRVSEIVKVALKDA